MVIETVNNFTRTARPDKYTTQETLISWKKKCIENRDLLEENKELSEQEKNKYKQELNKTLGDIDRNLKNIMDLISEAGDLAINLETISEAKTLKSMIYSLLEKGLKKEDKENIEVVGNILTDCLNDFNEISITVELSQRLSRIPLLMDKYEQFEEDVNICVLINDFKAEIVKKLSEENNLWMSKYNRVDKTLIDSWDSQKCYSFKSETDISPPYLFEENFKAISDKRAIVDLRIKELKIESVVTLFNQLSDSEKKQCLGFLIFDH